MGYFGFETESGIDEDIKSMINVSMIGKED